MVHSEKSEITREPEAIGKRRADIKNLLSTDTPEILDMTTLKKIARAFIKQKFPLSAAGLVLKEKTEQALNEDDVQELQLLYGSLPTVDNPHFELFDDLAVKEDESIFGQDLATVQSTKGCSKQCTFCLADASEKLEIMPYTAVAKLAERVQLENKKICSLMIDVFNKIKSETGYSVGDVDKMCFDFNSIPEKDYQKIIDIYNKHPISGLIPWRDDYIEYPHAFFMRRLPNFAGSDPFDYKDTSFLHNDGTPADYGDVFIAFDHPLRPVEINTAGWRRSNKTAQRGAEKIVKACLEGPREGKSNIINISVHRFSRSARLDYREYLEEMKNVIATFSPLKPVIKLYDNPNEEGNAEFIEVVVKPLLEFIKTLPEGDKIIIWNQNVRNIGRAAKEAQKAEYDEISDTSMLGIHIWPDGTIANKISGAKDSKPVATARRLYILSK